MGRSLRRFITNVYRRILILLPFALIRASCECTLLEMARESYVRQTQPFFSESKFGIINTYFMKRADHYDFEIIKMTSQTYSNFKWRIRAAGEHSL